MENLIYVTLIGLLFGTFGTTIGGFLGVCLKNPSKKILSFILALAGGLMTSIVCFELIPEAMRNREFFKCYFRDNIRNIRYDFL